ncbi:MAG: hypothetical protein PHY44_07750 [Lachnospiraceae bacterium]|nr:hypothetical protein [Lachnospiraceae bacterium]
MGVSVLVLGVSGTGKSASLRNFGADEIALVNVVGKPLPFKGKFKQTLNSDDYAEIKNFIKKTGDKPVVIDDAQYLMGNEFMRRVTERGYDKFSEMAQNFWELLDFVNKLGNEKRVYMLGHTERDADGNEKFKTMGKLIDQCINVEGTCTIVLKTCVSDGKYSFITQNNGRDTVKSPMGMFPAFVIDNDLKYVDEKIKNYYEFDGAASDEEVAAADEAAASDISEDEVKGKKARRSSSRRSKKNEQPEQDGTTNTDSSSVTLKEDTYFHDLVNDNYLLKHKGDVVDTIIDGETVMQVIDKAEFIAGCKRIAQNGATPDFMNIPDGADEEVPFDTVDEKAEEKPTGRRSRRKAAPKEDVADAAESNDDVPDDTETPATPAPTRRSRRVRK